MKKSFSTEEAINEVQEFITRMNKITLKDWNIFEAAELLKDEAKRLEGIAQQIDRVPESDLLVVAILLAYKSLQQEIERHAEKLKDGLELSKELERLRQSIVDDRSRTEQRFTKLHKS
jgi:signal transduction histidine kinase